MNIFVDGLFVLGNQAWTIFSISITVIWGQILIIALFKKIFKDNLASSEIISLGMAGWILPAFFLSMLFFGGAFLFGEVVMKIIPVLAGIAMIVSLLVGKFNRESQLAVLSFTPFLLVSLILQLAFLKNMLLPSYFDSAEHYRIIKYFSEYFVSAHESFLLRNYYHVGFHLISAMTSYVFHLGIVDTMLVFGQVVLAILPFSLFFIIKRETGSNMAATFTCLLAGVGWHMPSHLMDWGKYPALFSMVGIHFVLNIGYLLYRNNQANSKRLFVYWLLILGILVSASIHTRSLVVVAFMGLSLLLTIWRKRLPILFQRLSFLLVVLFLAVEIVAVQNSSVLALLFGAYVNQDILITSLAIVLLIFSAWAFPDLTFFLLLLISLLIEGLFIPVNGFLGYGALTLLDRPYVQMLLYLPLSIWSGLGVAGLFQLLSQLTLHSKLPTQLTACLLVIFVLLNARSNHAFYASTCCQIASHDDLAAIYWMEKTLPADAKILVASTDMFVTSIESPDALVGVDGGIWINPLTSRRTTSARGTLNFDTPKNHMDICQKNIGYIYAGGTTQSFNTTQLTAQTDLYQLVFSLPHAKVFQVIRCE